MCQLEGGEVEVRPWVFFWEMPTHCLLSSSQCTYTIPLMTHFFLASRPAWFLSLPPATSLLLLKIILDPFSQLLKVNWVPKACKHKCEVQYWGYQVLVSWVWYTPRHGASHHSHVHSSPREPYTEAAGSRVHLQVNKGGSAQSTEWGALVNLFIIVKLIIKRFQWWGSSM